MRYLLFTLGFLASSLYAQKGCTDPQASNYDPAARSNDGTCVYPNTLISPSILTQKLSDTLNETSGLAKFNEQWFSHNDGGNPAFLYQLNKNGKINKSHPLNHPNTDWEDLTFSDSFGFIGDFGNNAGNRKDLRILRFKTSALASTHLADTLKADVIALNYADQLNFSATTNSTPFDCEALIYWNDSLHLFTKNWLNGYTKRYVLPNKPGQYTVAPRDSLRLHFLVTGAAVYHNRIALVGYDKSGNGFLSLLWDFPDQQPFQGNKRHISLGSFIATGQIESIAFSDSTTLYATNEKYVVANRLMVIPLFSIWGSTAYSKTPKQPIGLTIAPNPTKGSLNVGWTQPTKRHVSIKIFPLHHPEITVYEHCEWIDAGSTNLQIPLSDGLAAGTYILQIDGIERKLRLQEKVIYQP
jgi:hypothetical protein